MGLFPGMKMMIYIHDIKIWIKPITEDYEEEGSLVRTLIFKSHGQVILPLPSKFVKTFQTKLGDMVHDKWYISRVLNSGHGIINLLVV